YQGLTRDVIARGIFSSVADLKRKLMRYIRQYNLAPKPVKWVHRNPAHRITTDSRVTVHQKPFTEGSTRGKSPRFPRGPSQVKAGAKAPHLDLPLRVDTTVLEQPG